MRRLLACCLLVATFICAIPLQARAAEKVDLLLVLAADVSRSVDFEKFKLQREGYAAAISDKRVLNAIASGRNGRIGLLFLEWSGFGSQKVVVDWTLIDGAKTAQAFGDRLLESPRVFADRTSISGGIEAAMVQLARAPFTSERQTIDVSGDGTNNAGPDVRIVRDKAVYQGITINGLVILSAQPLATNPGHTHPPGGLAKYYEDNVIGGPGAFVMVANDFHSFGDAIIKKMIAEIAGTTPANRQAALPRP